jgi:hypothetical protein
MASGAGPAKPGRGRGCRWGCGGCLGLSVLAACVVLGGFVAMRALRPDPKELYSGASDPVAEAAVSQALSDVGVEGARVSVIPIKGSQEQLAYIVLDDSAGFSASELAQGGEQGFANALRQLDEANRSQDLNIGQVAMEYRDETGEPMFVVATPQEDIQAFAAGEIDRDQLLAGTEVDLSNLLGGIDELSQSVGQ